LTENDIQGKWVCDVPSFREPKAGADCMLDMLLSNYDQDQQDHILPSVEDVFETLVPSPELNFTCRHQARQVLQLPAQDQSLRRRTHLLCLHSDHAPHPPPFRVALRLQRTTISTPTTLTSEPHFHHPAPVGLQPLNQRR
jgi:hypothetical protein